MDRTGRDRENPEQDSWILLMCMRHTGATLVEKEGESNVSLLVHDTSAADTDRHDHLVGSNGSVAGSSQCILHPRCNFHSAGPPGLRGR